MDPPVPTLMKPPRHCQVRTPFSGDEAGQGVVQLSQLGPNLGKCCHALPTLALGGPHRPKAVESGLPRQLLTTCSAPSELAGMGGGNFPRRVANNCSATFGQHSAGCNGSPLQVRRHHKQSRTTTTRTYDGVLDEMVQPDVLADAKSPRQGEQRNIEPASKRQLRVLCEPCDVGGHLHKLRMGCSEQAAPEGFGRIGGPKSCREFWASFGKFRASHT